VHIASLPTARDEIENSYDRDEQQNAAQQDEHIPHVLGHGLASRISATAQPTSAIHTQRASESRLPIRFSVAPPEPWAIDVASSVTGAAQAPVAVAPDGQQIAFVARNADV
jgi:hypothetical protein